MGCPLSFLAYFTDPGRILCASDRAYSSGRLIRVSYCYRGVAMPVVVHRIPVISWYIARNSIRWG